MRRAAPLWAVVVSVCLPWALAQGVRPDATGDVERPPQSAAQPAGQAPPDTEIYLAPLTRKGGTIDVGRPVNISNSPGYDNQPSFTPDGGAILFASARGGATDIYRYDIGARRVSRVTETAEAEYSPTVTPDGRHVSVVRVESDGTQRLWKFTLDGKTPSLVLPEVKPVGYHAWLDEATVALFVLGQPPTLQVASVTSGKAETVARGIGRSLRQVPGGGVSFVRRETQDGSITFTIARLSARSDGTFDASVLVRAPAPDSEPDVAWTPDGMLLAAGGGTLYGWRRGDPEWRPVADLRPFGLGTVSRLAVSAAGDWLAVVVQK